MVDTEEVEAERILARVMMETADGPDNKTWFHMQPTRHEVELEVNGRYSPTRVMSDPDDVEVEIRYVDDDGLGDDYAVPEDDDGAIDDD